MKTKSCVSAFRIRARTAGAVCCWAVVAFSAALIVVCLFFAGYSFAYGFPACAGKGYMLYGEDDGGMLPPDDLIIFEPCGDNDVSTGDYCVYRTRFGTSVGIVKTENDKAVVVTDGYGGNTLTAVPRSLVIGRAYRHNPVAGAVLGAVADSRNVIAAVAAVVAVWTAFSLFGVHGGRFLDASGIEEEIYFRVCEEKRKRRAERRKEKRQGRRNPTPRFRG